MWDQPESPTLQTSMSRASLLSRMRSRETAGPWSPEAGKLLDQQLGTHAGLDLGLALPRLNFVTLQSGDTDTNLPDVAMKGFSEKTSVNTPSRVPGTEQPLPSWLLSSHLVFVC